jgi:hypothetical protein
VQQAAIDAQQAAIAAIRPGVSAQSIAEAANDAREIVGRACSRLVQLLARLHEESRASSHKTLDFINRGTSGVNLG